MKTVRLAQTYWGIPSSFFEIWVKYNPWACGSRAILNPNFSEFRWYSPIRPRQTHSILSIQGGGHDSEKFLTIMSPPCIGQYRGGGHEIALFLLISGTLSFQALINLITMWKLCVWLGRKGKYHLHSSKLGLNTDLEPAALGPYWTPISQNSDGISQYVLARRTVFYQCGPVNSSKIYFNFYILLCIQKSLVAYSL